MKLRNQVCEKKYSIRLKELGVKQESLWWWCLFLNAPSSERGWLLVRYKTNQDFEYISAFTVAELGEMLPEYFKPPTYVYDNPKTKGHILTICKKYNVSYQHNGSGEFSTKKEKLINKLLFGFEADTEANARAKMLVYLLENKLITLER